MTALVALVLVLLAMLGELQVSRRNERTLRAQGAVEPPDPVYGAMRWVYPGTFVAMTLESLLASRLDARLRSRAGRSPACDR